MSKIFPIMHSKPESSRFIATVIYYPWVFVLVPMFMPFLGAGLWEQWATSAWLQIGYHVLNGIVLTCIMASYLKDEWFMFSTDLRYYLKHVGIAIGLIFGTLVTLISTLALLGIDVTYMLTGLPMGEMVISHLPIALLSYRPLFGTVAMTVFTPISICALFYYFCFAPICYRKPWLAYLAVALVTVLPPLVDFLWRGEGAIQLSLYIIRLPIHLLACWSYQKTDNPWTPLLTLAGTNLILCLLQILLLR